MKTITWKLHLKSDQKTVFNLLTTSEGRSKFWAEHAIENDGVIHFKFPNGQNYDSQIIKIVPNKEFQLNYFNSLVKIKLEPTENGRTELILTNENVSERDYIEVKAGWVSVLLNLKAVADYQFDLRNHDPKMTWDQGFVEN